jgi:hypothetical protein
MAAMSWAPARSVVLAASTAEARAAIARMVSVVQAAVVVVLATLAAAAARVAVAQRMAALAVVVDRRIRRVRAPRISPAAARASPTAAILIIREELGTAVLAPLAVLGSALLAMLASRVTST